MNYWLTTVSSVAKLTIPRDISIVLRLFQYLIADHMDNFVLHGFVGIGGELQPDLEQGVPDALGGVKIVAGFQWCLSFRNS